MDDPGEHHIDYATSIPASMRWARSHGYRTAITGEGHGPDVLALLLQRGNELLIVNVPATLR